MQARGAKSPVVAYPQAYVAAFVIGVALLLLAMGLGLYESLRRDKSPPWIVFQNMGEIEALLERQRYDEAISRLKMTLALVPSDQHLMHNLLGNAYAAQGEQSRAIEHYRRAVELRPGFADAHNNLGVALARSGRRTEAVEEFRRAVELRQDYTEALENLARAEARDGAERSARPEGQEQPQGEAAGLELGREYVGMFHRGGLSELYEKFTIEFASQMDLEALRTLHGRVREELGSETEVVRERAAPQEEGPDLYFRLSRFDRHDGLVEMSLAVNEDGSIAGFRIRLGETRPDG